MFNYFVRRFLLIIPTFLGCTIVVFAILQFTPGGPYENMLRQAQTRVAEGGAAAGGRDVGQVTIPEEAKLELKRYFGLDKPIHVRYVNWLGNILSGDFGTSYVYAEPVMDIITSRFPVSIAFGLTGFLLSYLVCIPLGIFKAIRHGSAFDFVSSTLVFIGYAIPGWALGTLMLAFLARQLGWFPLGEFRSEDWDMFSTGEQILDQAHHMVLPVISYMIGGFATLTILMKNSLMENLGQDYVRTAFAKGLSEKRVIFVHALRNSMIPIATGLGHVLSFILAGSFLIERTFNIDGIGLLGFKSAVNRDYTVVMGILSIAVVIQLIGNIFSDMLYAVFDPRIRFK
ncbi:MAG TPA: ABC transporter permease [Candidatus Kapabacteria bacterium]|jgi:microcin C transport system permease protein|nr:ABC transporter permease [Candidatus Kapabacteria bacterium]